MNCPSASTACNEWEGTESGGRWALPPPPLVTNSVVFRTVSKLVGKEVEGVAPKVAWAIPELVKEQTIE